MKRIFQLQGRIQRNEKSLHLFGIATSWAGIACKPEYSSFGQIRFNWLKRHLQHNSLPLLLASRFKTFWLGHVYTFRYLNFFWRFSFFSFSFLFAKVIGLLLGLLAVEKNF